MYYNKRQIKRLQENRIPLIAFAVLMLVLVIAAGIMDKKESSAKASSDTATIQKTVTPTATTDPEEITNSINTLQAHFSNLKRLSDDGVKASQSGNIVAFCADKTAIDSEVENMDDEMKHLQNITDVPPAVEAKYNQIQVSYEVLDNAAKNVC